MIEEINEKKLVKCDTCGNMTEDTNDPWERGGLYSISGFALCKNWMMSERGLY